MVVYIDDENRCHITDDGNMVAVEDDFFDSKCKAYIEGFCLEINDEGHAIYPFVDIRILNAYQAQYEEMLPEMEDMKNALVNELGVNPNG